MVITLSNDVIEMPSKPLIRWAGSKRKLIPVLVKNLPAGFTRYVEPFCGSACLFFHIQPKSALLSDFNPELINAYNQVCERADIYSVLCALPQTKEYYYELRAQKPEVLDEFSRAVRFLYLNRYCFNGIYRTNRQGFFNVPYGSRTGGFPSKEEYEHIRNSLLRASIQRLDARDAIRATKKGDFVYLDPPYSDSGRFTGEYGVGSFDSDRLEELYSWLERIDQKKAYFLLSYKATPQVIKKLKEKYIVSDVSVKRHISGFKKNWDVASEILVKNYE
ncbi:DNA adenine methylase [Thalassolituus sp. UBA3500]|uniref:DNA adenine methylase n=1 Tax=Thalassolituus sp. UBA3500 TaxID=1947664 RepID=UPI000C0ED322|nr:Dam family site-specific DNA-(adenine-N6)-methyltransferase [Thalassolituus sp. UBA3500]MBN57555.1 hypothetical protein [Oceanospirillaceae bacterium]|tara:strand:- start:16241 stop:17068 length:828 start_codon:yes stop_codon:yes gene_type:complete